jgi:hypothetical protein
MTEASTCAACGQGTYQLVPGANASAQCLACPEHSTTEAAGAARRTDCACAAGFVNGITEAGGGCSGCPANTYQSGNACAPCPPHTTAPEASTSVVQCASNAGYFAQYTRRATAQITVPVDEYNEETFLAYVLAAAGEGVRVVQ